MQIAEFVSDQSFTPAAANAHIGWAGRQFVLSVEQDAFVSSEQAVDDADKLHFTRGAYFCRIRGVDTEGLHIIRIYAVSGGGNRELRKAYVDARAIAALTGGEAAIIRPYHDHRAPSAQPAEAAVEEPARNPMRMVDAAIFVLALVALLFATGG